MEVIREKVLCKDENGNTLVAEIVDNLTEEESKEFPTYELNVEDDLTVDQQQELSAILRRYISSYGAHKDTMALNAWLAMMYREDDALLSEKEALELAEKTIRNVELAQQEREKIRKYKEMGWSETDYYANTLAKNKEFQALPNKREVLAQVDEALTNAQVDAVYRTASLEECESAPFGYVRPEILGQHMGQRTIQTYFTGIDTAIENANANMMKTIENLDGSINMNPNLDGYIAEQYHAGTFNIDAATKDMRDVVAEVLCPDGQAYTKNSVDIVIKEIKDGKAVIVQKYQAKYGKDIESTARYFEDKLGEYKYKFQRKLTPKGQADHIDNAVDKLSYKGAKSKPLGKEAAKDLQKKAQRGKTKDVLFDFASDVETKEVIKQVGVKSINMALMAGATTACAQTAFQFLFKDNIEAEEVVESAVTTGANVGISTAVAGALEMAARKKIITGVLAKGNVIATISCATFDCLTALYKMGTGEMSFKDGMGEISASIASAYVSTQAYALAAAATGTIATMVAAPAAAVTVATVVGGTLLAMAGTAVIHAVKDGIKEVVGGVVSATKSLVKAGASAVKTFAKGAYSLAKGAVSAVCSGVKTVGSAVWSGVKSLFSWF